MQPEWEGERLRRVFCLAEATFLFSHEVLTVTETCFLLALAVASQAPEHREWGWAVRTLGAFPQGELQAPWRRVLLSLCFRRLSQSWGDARGKGRFLIWGLRRPDPAQLQRLPPVVGGLGNPVSYRVRRREWKLYGSRKNLPMCC